MSLPHHQDSVTRHRKLCQNFIAEKKRRLNSITQYNLELAQDDQLGQEFNQICQSLISRCRRIHNRTIWKAYLYKAINFLAKAIIIALGTTLGFLALLSDTDSDILGIMGLIIAGLEEMKTELEFGGRGNDLRKVCKELEDLTIDLDQLEKSYSPGPSDAKLVKYEKKVNKLDYKIYKAELLTCKRKRLYNLEDIIIGPTDDTDDEQTTDTDDGLVIETG